MTTLALNEPTNDSKPQTAERPAWGAVWSLGLGVAGLVAAELLPVSLLTPMAADLRITEGLAGQAITATAVVALVTSLLTATLTQRLDRRMLFMAFSAVLIGSSLMMVFASSLTALILGRLLLGLAVGGFWSLAAATTMRLVPEAAVPRALAIVFGGSSIATITAAPLGSYLGGVIGWRYVFLVTAALGLVTLIWQFATFPSVGATGNARLRTLLDVFKRPRFGAGMLCIMLAFMGHFAFFTYLRPFLETVTHLGVNGVTGVLFGFGVATFAGTSLSGVVLERNLKLTLTALPAILGVLAAGLLAFGGVPWVAAVLVALWGMAFAAVPVGWSTWATRAVPDEAETAGGLLVATIQLAISMGAAAGGLAFDHAGPMGAFTVSGLVLLAGTLTAALALRRGTEPTPA